MANRNRLLKVALFSDSLHVNLLGAVVVGQHGDQIIVERPAPKPRTKPVTPRKPRAKKSAWAAQPESVQANG